MVSYTYTENTEKEVNDMELVVTANIRLLPTEEQHQQLVETMQAMKQALNFVSKVRINMTCFRRLRNCNH